MYKHNLVTTLALCGFIAGCATTPATPYWSDAHWIDQLGATVQTRLAESQALGDTSRAVDHVAVGFTYSGGSLEDVRIIQSTGSPALDDAVKAAVAQVHPPVARGPWADTPHTFALALYVGRGWTELTRDIHREIQQHVAYPVAAMLNGTTGVVVARFDYFNGRALDPHVTQSSGNADVDQSVINDLDSLRLPPPPPALRNHKLRFQSAVCFNRQSLRCPRSSESVYFVASATSAQPCSEVAFRYQGGKVTDVRLTKATEYPSLDKLALQLVILGEFPAPSGNLASTGKLSIPVCYTFNLESPDNGSGPDERDPTSRDVRASHAIALPYRPVPVGAGNPHVWP